MYITVLGLKGGVAKTTTVLHTAALMGGRTLVVDNDPNRYALSYVSSRNASLPSLPFEVLPMKAAMRSISDYDHVVFDTEARPDDDDIREYAGGCDLLVVPTTPAAMSVGALARVSQKLVPLGARWKALLTIVPPAPSFQGAATREALVEMGVPLFDSEIARGAAYEHASREGKLVWEMGLRGRKYGENYRELGKEIRRELEI